MNIVSLKMMSCDSIELHLQLHPERDAINDCPIHFSYYSLSSFRQGPPVCQYLSAYRPHMAVTSESGNKQLNSENWEIAFVTNLEQHSCALLREGYQSQ